MTPGRSERSPFSFVTGNGKREPRSIDQAGTDAVTAMQMHRAGPAGQIRARAIARRYGYEGRGGVERFARAAHVAASAKLLKQMDAAEAAEGDHRCPVDKLASSEPVTHADGSCTATANADGLFTIVCGPTCGCGRAFRVKPGAIILCPFCGEGWGRAPVMDVPGDIVLVTRSAPEHTPPPLTGFEQLMGFDLHYSPEGLPVSARPPADPARQVTTDVG